MINEWKNSCSMKAFSSPSGHSCIYCYQVKSPLITHTLVQYKSRINTHRMRNSTGMLFVNDSIPISTKALYVMLGHQMLHVHIWHHYQCLRIGSVCGNASREKCKHQMQHKVNIVKHITTESTNRRTKLQEHVFSCTIHLLYNPHTCELWTFSNILVHVWYRLHIHDRICICRFQCVIFYTSI